MRSASLLSSFDGRRGPKHPRKISLSRPTAIIAGISLVLLTAWSGASLLYVITRDDLALTFLERQVKLKRGYEEQLKALQAQVEQASRQHPGEDTLERRLRELLARQDAFEARQAVVQPFAEQVGMGSAGLSAPGPASNVEVTSPVSAAHAYAPAPKPKPDADDLFQLRLRRPEGTKPDRTSSIGSIEENLKRAEIRLAGFERAQVRLLESVVQVAEAEAMHLHAAIRRTGVELAAFGPAPERAGGPLIPATGATEAFKVLAAQARTSIDRLVMLRRSMAALPFGEPIDGEIDFSSGFGYRIDPFTRSPALHSGLDFRAEFGASVRAAGAGQVVTADYSGAYGNMVEIAHGNGVTSRYAHLSAITVELGQTVQMGTKIGHVGSTGRSTGPHLHYETRIAGEPVNPHRFLKAGLQLAPVAAASR
jgi:murein DD-endopeptidase MepM/ murein hydrolase activator NlpD